MFRFSYLFVIITPPHRPIQLSTCTTQGYICVDSSEFAILLDAFFSYFPQSGYLLWWSWSIFKIETVVWKIWKVIMIDRQNLRLKSNILQLSNNYLNYDAFKVWLIYYYGKCIAEKLIPHWTTSCVRGKLISHWSHSEFLLSTFISHSTSKSFQEDSIIKHY